MQEFVTKDTEIPVEVVDIWQRIVDSMAGLLHVPSLLITRVEEPELAIFRANTQATNPFPSGTRMPLLGVYCEHTARTRKRNQIEDARLDPRWRESPTAKVGIYSYLGFPLLWPTGEVFGTICAIDTKANKWLSPSDSLLQTVKDAVEAHLGLVAAMDELNRKNDELAAALGEVKTLRGLLPICASCKQIRDDRGEWVQMEIYVRDRSEARFSHGICPTCARQLYPDMDLDDE